MKASIEIGDPRLQSTESERDQPPPAQQLAHDVAGAGLHPPVDDLVGPLPIAHPCVSIGGRDGDEVASLDVALADLDGDETPEIVIGCNGGTVYALSASGEARWAFQAGSAVRSTPAIADLDGDSAPEVVVGSMDGAVYALGGKRDDNSYLSTVERFDPRAGKWANVAPMGAKRSWFAAAVLDGAVYALGGYALGGGASNTVERFDPRAGKWADVAPMGARRQNFAAAVL